MAGSFRDHHVQSRQHSVNKDMLRIACTILGSTAVIVRFCVLGGLGLGATLAMLYAIYWAARHGGLPEASLASLYVRVYEYLLPDRYVVLNTVFIHCVKMPLVVLLWVLFILALLLDKLVSALFWRMGMVFRSDEIA